MMDLGVYDPMLRMMAQCGKNRRNESRNLHSLIHKTGKTYGVEVSTTSTRVRVLSGKPCIKTVNYPILRMSSWAKALLKSSPGILLAGCSLKEPEKFRDVFSQFWSRYRSVRPDLDLFSQSWDFSYCIPIGYHGDEGRGKLRRPIMIMSIQPIISRLGVEFTNASGQLGPHIEH